MLIEFSVANYLSFRNPCTLSMVASKDTELPGNVLRNAGGTGYDLLRVVGVFGANASGKSNLFRAMSFFRWMVQNSAKETQLGEPINVSPFVFDPSLAEEPSEFEMTFIVGEAVYRYGFACTRDRIKSEYLYEIRRSARKLAVRHGDGIEYGRSLPRKGLPDAPRENALWLSQAAMTGHTLAGVLVQAIYLAVMPLPDVQDPLGTHKVLQQYPELKSSILDLLRRTDLNIVNFAIAEASLEESRTFAAAPSAAKDAIRAQWVENDRIIEVDFTHFAEIAGCGEQSRQFAMAHESDGTKKIFAIAGPILMWMKAGRLVLADELDLRLHPLLLELVIRLFLDQPEDGRAQLLFSSHSPLPMDEGFLRRGTGDSKGAPYLRRDQIYFTDKGPDAATDLYTLWDYGSSRKGEDRRRRYLKGFYRAIPDVKPAAPEPVK